MRTLLALQRLAQIEIDAIAAEIRALEAHARQAEAAKTEHAAQIVKEQDAARNDILALRAYALFAPRAGARAIAFADEVAALESAIGYARAKLLDAMAERKKLERLAEIQAERAETAERAEEQADLDEVAAIRAARLRH